MKLEIIATNRFRKDVKAASKRGYDIGLLLTVIDQLSESLPLPERHRDHALTGDWQGFRECHVLPDWLLIYRIDDDVLVLTLFRTGTHSDLF